MRITGGKISFTKGGLCTAVCFNGTAETAELKLSVSQTAEHGGTRYTAVLTPKTAMTLCGVSLTTDQALSDETRLFLNGYQTWTESAELRLTHRIPRLNVLAKRLIGMYGDYDFYKGRRHKLQSWTYTYLRGPDGITLCGSLSEKSGFTVFEYDKREKRLCVLKDCGGLELKAGEGYAIFDLFIITAEENAAFDAYFAAAEIAPVRAKPATGWTSWYNYYTKVTEKNILDNLSAFSAKSCPIDIFQIDDGFQTAVGDWLSINKKFPRGMAHLADEIHQAGYKAGLWLAPIVCEKRSLVYRQHPDWVLCKAGFNPGWSGIFYTLDFYNPEVRAYLREVFDTVLNRWGYDMVKLDFLYAAALPKRRDKTRGEVMCEFFAFLREISGDKLILGCGAPLGPAFGVFDYCRVSSDVSLTWEDSFLRLLHYRERVSTRNALTSTIGRYQLDGRAFHNDPDVFILRDDNNRLSAEQKYTLYKINSLLGGLVFTSDNISRYTHEQAARFNARLSDTPKTHIRVETDGALRIFYTQDETDFCLIGNLTNRAVSVRLPFGGTLLEKNRLVFENETLGLPPFKTLTLRAVAKNAAAADMPERF